MVRESGGPRRWGESKSGGPRRWGESESGGPRRWGESESGGPRKDRLIIHLFFMYLFLALFCKADSILSVIKYGSLQISMVRHGDKYATNRDGYAFEDVPSRYHGMTHVRGLNDKFGTIRFHVNVAVKVYLAVDSRYPYIHGASFKNTGDLIMLGGTHARTPFYIYESVAEYGPGFVEISFPQSRMTAIFLRDSHKVKPAADLSVRVTSSAWQISMVREGEKFSTNRKCYAMSNIPPRFYGMTHLRGVNDKPMTIKFTVNVPIKVYIAIDSRYPSPLDSKLYKKTGEKIVHAGCHKPTDFPIWERTVTKPGLVTLNLSASRMMGLSQDTDSTPFDSKDFETSSRAF
ncbi:hypothetical protein QZH41_000457 [Actinostola sp. cb2023]|nr:hypothetical protein QZH41_000457 [Actinostola sp. cb2023]